MENTKELRFIFPEGQLKYIVAFVFSERRQVSWI